MQTENKPNPPYKSINPYLVKHPLKHRIMYVLCWIAFIGLVTYGIWWIANN